MELNRVVVNFTTIFLVADKHEYDTIKVSSLYCIQFLVVYITIVARV